MDATFKSAVILQFIQKFEEEISALTQSAKAAHEAATHEESKSEDKHDTRAIEASYLAAGQAARLAELEKGLEEFRKYPEVAHHAFHQIRPGALAALVSNA